MYTERARRAIIFIASGRGRHSHKWEVYIDGHSSNPSTNVFCNSKLTARAPGDVLLSYLQALQLTGSELQSFMALQCLFDGVLVRSTFAVATPLVPLGLLTLCSFMEFFSRGMGDLERLEALKSHQDFTHSTDQPNKQRSCFHQLKQCKKA